jgi:ATP-binding cassette subfamily B protein
LEGKKKKFDRNLLLRILSFGKPYQSKLWLSISLSIILAVLTPFRPYLIQYTIDHYIENKLLQGLIFIAVIQFGLLLLETALRFIFSFVTSWLGQTVVNDIRRKVHEKVINQNLSYYDNTPIGTLTTRTINDIESINDIFSEGFISILADVLTILALIGIMLYTDWRLTLVSLAVFPLLLLAT